MAFQRGIDGPQPVTPEPLVRPAGPEERRRADATRPIAVGTLACPECDAPAPPGPRALAPADPLACGYCGRSGAVRDFLSLAGPPRAAQVAVRVAGRR